LGIPLERDERGYAHAGQLTLQRIPPCKLSHNMKFQDRIIAAASSTGQINTWPKITRQLVSEIMPTKTDYFFGHIPQSVETLMDYMLIHRRSFERSFAPKI